MNLPSSTLAGMKIQCNELFCCKSLLIRDGEEDRTSEPQRARTPWDRTLPACTRFREISCTQDACGPGKRCHPSVSCAMNFIDCCDAAPCSFVGFRRSFHAFLNS